jgi:hypothetical protein
MRFKDRVSGVTRIAGGACRECEAGPDEESTGAAKDDVGTQRGRPQAKDNRYKKAGDQR